MMRSMKKDKEEALCVRCQSLLREFERSATESDGEFRPGKDEYASTLSVARQYYAYAACHQAMYAMSVDGNSTPVRLSAFNDRLSEIEGELDFVEERGLDGVKKSMIDSFEREARRIRLACKMFSENNAWSSDAVARRDEGYDDLSSLSDVAESRDFLEFLWRAAILRSADGSRVGADLKNRFRMKIDEIDRDLRRLFEVTRFPEPWADDSFWWRTPLSSSKE